jgi:curved DNA-binding protein CbpA
MKDHYQVLGLLREVDEVVIKAAYKALAQKYHPDKHPADKAEHNRIMSELNEAYAVLGFKHRRKEYDLKWSKASAKSKPTKTKQPPHHSTPDTSEPPKSEHNEAEHKTDTKERKTEFDHILKKLRENQMDEYQLINLFENTFSLKVEISSGYINNYSYMKDDKRHIVNFEKIKLELINHLTR